MPASELEVAPEDSVQYETAMTTKLIRRLRQAQLRGMINHLSKSKPVESVASSHQHIEEIRQLIQENRQAE